MTDSNDVKLQWIESRLKALEISKEKHNELIAMLREDVKSFEQQKEMNNTLTQLIKLNSNEKVSKSKLWDRLITLITALITALGTVLIMLAKFKGWM